MSIGAGPNISVSSTWFTATEASNMQGGLLDVAGVSDSVRLLPEKRSDVESKVGECHRQ